MTEQTIIYEAPRTLTCACGWSGPPEEAWTHRDLRLDRSSEQLKFTEAILQIVIEAVREESVITGWTWDAFGKDKRLFGGSASSLSMCLDSMREYLRDEGTAL